jgi:hypothetical protein
MSVYIDGSGGDGCRGGAGHGLRLSGVHTSVPARVRVGVGVGASERVWGDLSLVAKPRGDVLLSTAHTPQHARQSRTPKLR